MKHSDSTRPGISSWGATLLIFLVPLVLIIPNIWLTATEQNYSVLARISNIILPLGFYGWIMTAGPRSGLRALWLLPIMILAAFQIVLLFLYGEAIIAIDMFLNVATTSVHEATELLSNLGTAITTVLLIYLPVLVLAVIVTTKSGVCSRFIRMRAGFASWILSLAGLVCFIIALFGQHVYNPTRQLFPVNVVSNMFFASERTMATAAYHTQVAPKHFNAYFKPEKPDSVGRLVVMIVGETSRAGNWQLGGYERPTTPHLASRDGLVYFRKTLTESNTTHKSVPLMLSAATAETFGDSIYSSHGVVEAFNEAGYTTAWFSNQPRNRSLIDFFSFEADSCLYLCDKDNEAHYDHELANILEQWLSSRRRGENLFVVLHTYGSHFNYRDRVPAGFGPFAPVEAKEASEEYRQELLNAYDNTIAYTDSVLDRVLAVMENSGRPAAAVYAADHGEDIFDDARGRFLHASPHPTYYQIHVPMFVWLSPSYSRNHPGMAERLRSRSNMNVSSSEAVFHTLLNLGELSADVYNPDKALTGTEYTEPKRQYVDDYDESVSLYGCGLKDIDIAKLHELDISVH